MDLASQKLSRRKLGGRQEEGPRQACSMLTKLWLRPNIVISTQLLNITLTHPRADKMAGQLSSRQQLDLYALISNVPLKTLTMNDLDTNRYLITFTTPALQKHSTSFGRRYQSWCARTQCILNGADDVQQSDFVPDSSSPASGLLVKKWTSIIRMQRKVRPRSASYSTLIGV